MAVAGGVVVGAEVGLAVGGGTVAVAVAVGVGGVLVAVAVATAVGEVVGLVCSGARPQFGKLWTPDSAGTVRTISPVPSGLTIMMSDHVGEVRRKRL